MYIYMYSLPNGWTEWAEIFCGHTWVVGEFYRLKKVRIFFLTLKKKFFFHMQRRALQLVNYKPKFT